jgi:AraC family transcriptional regulator
LILGLSVNESFSSFLARLSSQAASRGANARGFAIEPYWGARGDGPGPASDKQHILTMCSKHPHRFEIRHGVNRRTSYFKPPGSLTVVPAGECPLLRAETEFDLVVCAFSPELVTALDSELERRPEGGLHLQPIVEDPAAQQLMTLLIADANEGYTTERLYTEYLAQALAVRMLFLARGETKPPSDNRGTSGLPGHVLRRIIERMRCFSCDLSLQALANESGYSRVHFIRMFRAATGYSPHNYLLNLRLERARELLKNSSLSLIDIALDCGFSSHSHMSRLFHKGVGITPSAYRRTVRPSTHHWVQINRIERCCLVWGIYSLP